MKTTQKLKLSSADEAEGQKLILQRAELPQWGWKDPRSCLFLDFWKREMPGLKVLALFRPVEEVLDSINRRSLKQDAPFPKSVVVPVWHSAENRPLMNRYLSTWMCYNRSLLNFAATFPEDFLAIPTTSFVKNTSKLLPMLRHWGFQLDEPSETDYLREDLLHNVPSGNKYHLHSAMKSEADQLLSSLHQLAVEKGFS